MYLCICMYVYVFTNINFFTIIYVKIQKSKHMFKQKIEYLIKFKKNCFLFLTIILYKSKNIQKQIL